MTIELNTRNIFELSHNLEGIAYFVGEAEKKEKDRQKPPVSAMGG